MIVFADNDVIAKLCIYDILDAAIGGLGVERADLHVLNELRYQLRRKLKPYAPMIEPALSTFTVIEAEAPEPYVSALKNVRKIDEGEVLLFAHAAANEAAIITTGDKRALCALAGQTTVAAKLAGRVICFEQLVRGAIRTEGFATVLQRVLPNRGYDMALLAAFGSGPNSVEDTVVDMLDAYIEDLRKATGTLLSRY